MLYDQSQLADPNSDGPPDGFTFFGTLADIQENDQEEDDMRPSHDTDQKERNLIIVNDFVIPSRNQQSAEQHRGRHF